MLALLSSRSPAIMGFCSQEGGLGVVVDCIAVAEEEVMGTPSKAHVAHQGLTQPIQQLEGSGTTEVTSFQREITKHEGAAIQRRMEALGSTFQRLEGAHPLLVRPELC